MIYLNHFRLREPPFGITPDTSFFFSCASIQEALNTLAVAIANGEGFIKITGEVGTGKTLLCRKFLASLDENWVSAFVPNPGLSPHSLLLTLADELGVPVPAGLDEQMVVKSLTQKLLDIAQQGKGVVVCLDEVQAMPTETLETLRLLTNLETEKRKLVQVVLFGQPELDDRLAQESVRQLRQRITFQHRLGHLTVHETRHYLTHRLAVAGYQGDPVFTMPAVRRLHDASRGTPRLINILAHKALMLAFGEGSRMVRWRHVGAAVRDTPSAGAIGQMMVWLALACIAGSGIGWMLLR